MKSAVQFLIALFIVLTMVIPTGLAAADESFIVFTGDREEYKYSDPLYVLNNGENRVAYCYNASKKVPPTWQEGGQTVYKIESATAEEFYQMTDENVRVMEPEAFKKAILSVCYQGFPQNGSGLMEKYGLTRAAFRCITQLAVWYYTDSLDISQYYQQYQPFDTYPGAWAAYQELITPLDTLPLGYQLDLYRNRNEQYQNVLCTRLAEMPVQTSIQLKGIKLLEGAPCWPTSSILSSRTNKARRSPGASITWTAASPSTISSTVTRTWGCTAIPSERYRAICRMLRMTARLIRWRYWSNT